MAPQYSLAIFLVAVAAQVSGNCVSLPLQAPAPVCGQRSVSIQTQAPAAQVCASAPVSSYSSSSYSSVLSDACPAPTVISTPPVSIPLSLPNIIPLGTFAAVKSVSIKPSLTQGLNCENNLGWHQTAPIQSSCAPTWLNSALSSAGQYGSCNYGSQTVYTVPPSSHSSVCATKPQVFQSC